MADKSQSFENHAKMVPLYHYVTSAFLVVAAVHAFAAVGDSLSFPNLAHLALVLGALLTFWYARSFALGVQDRVIRLEERLRLAEVLPGDLRPRIDEIPTDALIGLRFASDEELPDLVRRVLDGGLTKRKEIKQAVKSWRPDRQRI